MLSYNVRHHNINVNTAAIALIAIVAIVDAAFSALRFIKWYQAEQQKALRTVGTFLRILPALAEHEHFFKLLELRCPKSHHLERHGPMLRHFDLRARATTGHLEVAGLVGEPVTTTRWLRHEDLLQATELAIEYWENGERPSSGVFKFEFPDVIGEGYLKNTRIPFATKVAKVIVRKGKVVTAFPAEA